MTSLNNTPHCTVCVLLFCAVIASLIHVCCVVLYSIYCSDSLLMCLSQTRDRSAQKLQAVAYKLHGKRVSSDFVSCCLWSTPPVSCVGCLLDCFAGKWHCYDIGSGLLYNLNTRLNWCVLWARVVAECWTAIMFSWLERFRKNNWFSFRINEFVLWPTLELSWTVLPHRAKQNFRARIKEKVMRHWFGVNDCQSSSALTKQPSYRTEGHVVRFTHRRFIRCCLRQFESSS